MRGHVHVVLLIHFCLVAVMFLGYSSVLDQYAKKQGVFLP